jgi:hypothetical protein
MRYSADAERFPQLAENRETGTSLEDFMPPLPLRAAFRNLFVIPLRRVNMTRLGGEIGSRSIGSPCSMILCYGADARAELWTNTHEH